MKVDISSNNKDEKRSDPRTLIDKYYSVDFSLKGLEIRYQFKLRDISNSGMCILVKEDSSILKHLKFNDTIDIKYYSPKTSGSPDNLKTRIKHITKCDQGRYKGHYLVGLSIVEKE